MVFGALAWVRLVLERDKCQLNELDTSGHRWPTDMGM